MTRVIMDAVEHGTPVEEVDEAVMSLGMPMAPSVLLQMVGPRVANHVLERMHDAFPDRFPLSPALAAIADGGEPVVVERAPRTREQIVEDVLEAVADEIHLLLEEGVVAEAADVDTGLLLGAGWPFFLGGITKHLDQIGHVASVCSVVHSPTMRARQPPPDGPRRLARPDRAARRGRRAGLPRAGSGCGRATRKSSPTSCAQHRLAVSQDGDTVFVYAATGMQAEQAAASSRGAERRRA